MNPRLNNKHALLSKTGSFWADTVSESTKEIARTLVHLPTLSRHDSMLEESQRNLEGYAYVWVDNVDLPFSEDNVLTLDRRTQERIVEFHDGVFVTFRPSQYTAPYDQHNLLFTESGDYEALATEAGDLIFFPADGAESHLILSDYRPVYFLPIPPQYKPSALQGLSRILLVGIDFQVGDGVLVFWESPSLLFGRTIRILAGTENKHSLMNFSYKLEKVNGGVDHVAHYNRDNQSARSFELAIAQACGMTVCPEDTRVQLVQALGRGKRYVFDGFSLDVPYAHEALVAGSLLEKHTVIGNHVKVYSGNDSSWYKALDWSEGLSLDGLCPVKGLTVPDAQIRVDTAVEGVDFHARPHLQGEEAALARYWAYLQRNEELTGVHLNEVVGLTSLSDVLYMNGLDLFMQTMIGNRAVVVTLRTRDLGSLYHKRALAFIQREKPVGSIVIIKEYTYTPQFM
jgi:hypothetical protein